MRLEMLVGVMAMVMVSEEEEALVVMVVVVLRSLDFVGFSP